MLRLMIADDERILRETISNLINWESLGVKLIGLCQNGLEAYDMILDEYPDIVLTDIKMPGLSGLELIEKITLLDPNIHFIILSGYEDFSYAKKAMRFGIKHYLLKPCNEKLIVESIKDTISDINRKYIPASQPADNHSFLLQRVTALAGDFWNSSPDLQVKALSRLQTMLSDIYDIDFLRTLISHFLLGNLVSPQKTYGDHKQITELLLNLKTMEDRIGILDNFYLFLHSFNSSIINKQVVYKDFIEKTMEYVNNNLSNPSLSLKWIAENILYMNVDYVSKQFVKETGLKFSTYLCDLRIARAKNLLLNGGSDKIYEVAEKVGCGNNPQYFTQLFKKNTGLTPSGYIMEMSQSSKIP